MGMRTNNLGFPRIGENRELKKATEAFWKRDITAAQLLQRAARIRENNWLLQAGMGIDLIPSNDFSLYDSMLDMCCTLGAVPDRFGWSGGAVGLDTYFAMARGVEGAEPHGGTPPLEMTKWFDTNYHYLVPEFHRRQRFRLSLTKALDEFEEGRRLGTLTKPVLIGPVSFLALGKEKEGGFDRLSLLPDLLPVYSELLSTLAGLGAQWVQLDEPCLILDLTQEQKQDYLGAYRQLRESVPGLRLMIASYFGPLGDNVELMLGLPAAAYHLDLVRGGEDLAPVLAAMPAGAELSLGVINGRNVWKNDYTRSLEAIGKAKERMGSDRLMVAPSCSLLHSPITLAGETGLPPELRKMLAFAVEKLGETAELAALAENRRDRSKLEANRRSHQAWRQQPEIHQPQVQQRLREIGAPHLQRSGAFPERLAKQKEILPLPLFPTTTIGSFPQTGELRAVRQKFRQEKLSREEYEGFIEERIRQLIKRQEEIGLDLLVHGEFERSDMVEYFAELLDGFTFTANGWVQSYGSRCVKPPIIYGDVQRAKPMTVRWSAYAQSLTDRPVKGMLTGPVTIQQWSFVREDQPPSETARQIALALRDEVGDLEAAGIKAIQIDEPALREGLPFKKKEWGGYLQWAVDSFRLASCGARDETQIHSHMCYAEFGDIIEAIIALDADVLSIEASRSQMELLADFRDNPYPNHIGPGIYDVHSPRIPEVAEIVTLLEKACRVLPKVNIWVNPDCGLKTRGEIEAWASLKNMAAAAKEMRKRWG
ncbi:MAG: 5-methyltetrahydropteroyltriglutamate--homocysteine S-methyltransferase [Desulfuromonadales bacterium]|nr:5-methyltetrahydropteroyltriglutamate--homocysteine S-methyltransferase [Desulfuromonadales bacterium]